MGLVFQQLQAQVNMLDMQGFVQIQEDVVIPLDMI